MPLRAKLGYHARKLITMIVQKLAITLLIQRQQHSQDLEEEILATQNPNPPAQQIETQPPRGCGIEGTRQGGDLQKDNPDLWASLREQFGGAPSSPRLMPTGPFLSFCPSTTKLVGPLSHMPGSSPSDGIGSS